MSGAPLPSKPDRQVVLVERRLMVRDLTHVRWGFVLLKYLPLSKRLVTGFDCRIHMHSRVLNPHFLLDMKMSTKMLMTPSKKEAHPDGRAGVTANSPVPDAKATWAGATNIVRDLSAGSRKRLPRPLVLLPELMRFLTRRQ